MSALHVDRRNAGATALPLALVHGWGMNLAVFDTLRDALPRTDTWAIDLPGHGRSAWHPARADFESQLESVLAALPPRSVLLGWSLGGELAMEIARAPSRARRGAGAGVEHASLLAVDRLAAWHECPANWKPSAAWWTRIGARR